MHSSKLAAARFGGGGGIHIRVLSVDCRVTGDDLCRSLERTVCTCTCSCSTTLCCLNTLPINIPDPPLEHSVLWRIFCKMPRKIVSHVLDFGVCSMVSVVTLGYL
jgi:hypothetical protein